MAKMYVCELPEFTINNFADVNSLMVDLIEEAVNHLFSITSIIGLTETEISSRYIECVADIIKWNDDWNNPVDPEALAEILGHANARYNRALEQCSLGVL